jgi:hypothetical protein
LSSRYTITAPRSRHFPLDMLRYAESFPATTDDANLIEGLIERNTERLPRDVVINLRTGIKFNSACFAQACDRWKSFGWRVIRDVAEADRANYTFATELNEAHING